MLTKDEIKTLDLQKTNKEVNEARKEHYRLKVGVRTKHLKDSHKTKLYKAYVARLLTHLNTIKKQEIKTEETATKESTKQ